MSFKIAAVAALASLATTVSAHGYLQNIDISGQTYWGYNNSVTGSPELVAWSDTVTDNGFTNDLTGAEINCHKGAEPGALSAKVSGGGKVTFTWNTWPESHKGPVITYLAKCDGDCSKADKTTLKWFKIDAKGLISGDSNSGTWASDQLISNGNSWDVTIPDSIASGNYVARHEIIALHSAGSEGGAQNYPQCVNLEVSSSGSDEPEGTLGTKLYSADDAGILVNIYYPVLTSYDIPGPTLYSGASSGASATGASSAQASSAQATSAASSASAVASSSAQVTTNVQVAASVAQTTAAAAQTTAAAADNSADVVTATQTDVVTASTAVTVTAGQASATQAISALASAVPSEVLTSTISTGIPTATASSGVAKPTKALPEGTTLEDLLSWVEYLFSEYSTSSTTSSKLRRHARDLFRN